MSDMLKTAGTIREIERLRAINVELLATLRNPAGLDEHALIAMDVHTLRATVREYRDEARAAIAKAKGE